MVLTRSQIPIANGAMAYWQGLTEPNDWNNLRRTLLILAEKKGFTLPAGMKKDWVSYQQSVAQNFEISKNKYYTNDMSQAYRLYVLALANQPATSAMNRLREYGGLTNEARWLLAIIPTVLLIATWP
ncbi:MAG: hypothetical protein IPG08_11710 [Sphingobacteriaceae bacterium]|nr:hypothetical protein [Sphingobacteriaceae bacterium]